MAIKKSQNWGGRAFSIGNHPSQSSAKRNAAATSQPRPSLSVSFAKAVGAPMHGPAPKKKGAAVQRSLITHPHNIPRTTTAPGTTTRGTQTNQTL